MIEAGVDTTGADASVAEVCADTAEVVRLK